MSTFSKKFTKQFDFSLTLSFQCISLTFSSKPFSLCLLPVGVCTDEYAGVRPLRVEQHGGLRDRLRLACAKRPVDDEGWRVARALSHNVLHDLHLVFVQHRGAVKCESQSGQVLVECAILLFNLRDVSRFLAISRWLVRRVLCLVFDPMLSL